MLRRYFLAFFSAVAASPSLAVARRIARVTVRDADFRPVREISSELNLAAFTEHWASRRQSATAAFRPEFKIDIQYDRRSERWLYDPAGFIRVLSKSETPVYQLESPSTFNALLGITP